ncbi:MAG: spermidine/putrescine transport system permease protein, partial [Solirubrobacteraceae bacterium]|nr:spermidine/putrescine transport system permease protein [Solirubrobacteraceae bacterium]
MRRRVGRLALHHSLNVWAALVLLYLMLPIAVILLFSFNDTHSKFNFAWQGFTFKNWGDPFGAPGLLDAMRNSLEIALISTIIATTLGTFMALALVRYQFRGRAPINLFIFLPLATPEVVLGAALLSQFLN